MLNYGHLVLSQSTGLIRTDNLSTSQSFYRRQLPDNGVALGHVGNTDGQYNGYYCCQTFGNSRYSQGNSNHEST